MDRDHCLAISAAEYVRMMERLTTNWMGGRMHVVGQIQDCQAGHRPLPAKPTRQIPPISSGAYAAIKRYC